MWLYVCLQRPSQFDHQARHFGFLVGYHFGEPRKKYRAAKAAGTRTAWSWPVQTCTKAHHARFSSPRHIAVGANLIRLQAPSLLCARVCIRIVAEMRNCVGHTLGWLVDSILLVCVFQLLLLCPCLWQLMDILGNPASDAGVRASAFSVLETMTAQVPLNARIRLTHDGGHPAIVFVVHADVYSHFVI
jgi:hypothetical protein